MIDATAAGDATRPRPWNLCVALLDDNVARGRGGKTAIVECREAPAAAAAGRAFTYADILDAACRAGNALAALGVVRGERVIIALPDGRAWLACFLGAARLGAVPVPINPILPASDYARILADSEAACLVAHADARSRWLPAIEAAGRPIAVLLDGYDDTGDAGARKREGGGAATSLAAAMEAAAATLAPAPASPDDDAFWLYSSGTTGKPKGVVHSQRSVLFSADRYASGVLGARPDDVFFSAAKLFFAYGMGNGFYFPFRCGAAAAHLAARPVPEAVFATLAALRPTLFFAVPSLYAALLDHARGRDLDIGSVRLAVSAGEPLPAEIYRRFRDRFGIEIVDGIGSTEMVHIFISNRPGEVRPGSTGRPVPGYDARVVCDSGAPVAAGEIGNLEVRGASAFRRYWRDADATARAQRDGWVRTGDKYRVDADGYYWYEGRIDDMLKVGGAWVSPFEVEAALLEHPDVLECAVIGIEDDHRLVKPKAFVVLRDDRRPTGDPADLERGLQSFVKARIAPYKYPRRIEFVDALPKTVTGKIQRFRLREREESGRGRRPAP